MYVGGLLVVVDIAMGYRVPAGCHYSVLNLVVLQVSTWTCSIGISLYRSLKILLAQLYLHLVTQRIGIGS